MGAREDLLQEVKNILFGPNPLPGFTQENGEEILFFDSPLKTYVTGVLFPQMLNSEGLAEEESEVEIIEGSGEEPPEIRDEAIPKSSVKNVTEAAIESETSKINSYKQSAMGLTLCIDNSVGEIEVSISAGSYIAKESFYPVEKKDENGNTVIEMSEKRRKCYYRLPLDTIIAIPKSELPTARCRYRDDYTINDASGAKVSGLGLGITYRMFDEEHDCSIYTFTLINHNKTNDVFPQVEECWFQTSFMVSSTGKLRPLPDTFCAEVKDEDYQLNSMLYRNIKTYGIGHGCSATWDDSGKVNAVTAEAMPEYEVKPILPGNSSAKLSMKMYSDEPEMAVEDLNVLCDEYGKWINKKEIEANELDEKYVEVAKKQIRLAKQCRDRMKKGIEILKTDSLVMQAFQLANRAMLMQQLHYNMPLVGFSDYDADELEFLLEKEILLPDVENEETWPGDDKSKFGKWRPFQIAFILLNINSMVNLDSDDRDIVDLIWFPTGGGKTEAYLGLTAFTILYRRLTDPRNAGTTVIMRYTLRLLTAQQYERASSLICSLEKIRSENEKVLGKKRITIGLWVGDSLTDNDSKEVIRRIKKIRKGEEFGNVSIALKCPWCGASMETFKKEKSYETPGYSISDDKKHVMFCCGNPGCDYHDEDTPLPLNLFDDEIYAEPPTLLFGTVDKFAMLPFKPEAKALFGGESYSPPELIIQDELHLITGPLGSTVGLYETAIFDLCCTDTSKPKIIASTATISHAKQQCNALYGCGEENVFQFPVQGLTYDDCFFAEEKTDAIGRKYVGLYGAAAPSSATASIYTFAAFLYAAKAICHSDKEKDPYWTNLSYFGSMRELGQAATWYIADIKERLEVIYRNRLLSSQKDKRRYIYESGLAELTSRMSNTEIPQILKRLEIRSDEGEKQALDVCLATNMVSVGVDVPRLGLMTVTGQPKSFSEYIQATSRVGRSAAAPGLVFVIYNTSKPRDKSYYEKFQSQHSRLYKNVEATSVTPFSRPLRERALHAVMIILYRMYVEGDNKYNARRFPTDEEYERICNIILSRAKGIDASELEDIKKQLDTYLEEWKAWTPEKYESNPYTLDEDAPLMRNAGIIAPKSWGSIGWNTQMSMRNVDRECRLDVRYIQKKEE